MARSANTSAKQKYERQKELAKQRQRRRRAKLSKEKIEEKRKYDRDRRAKLKAENKIFKIADMTPREQRKMRNYWRERNKVRSEKNRALAAVLEDAPPRSPTSNSLNETIEKQKKEISGLKRLLEKYKKRLQSEKEKFKDPASPCPRKQVKQVVGKESVPPAVKKQLFLDLPKNSEQLSPPTAIPELLRDYSGEKSSDIIREKVDLGEYIIVEFKNASKKSKAQQFIGICRSKLCNNEIDVMFMKACVKNNSLYVANENDCVSVDVDQIKALLHPPKVIQKGKRVFYKFSKSSS